MSPHCVTVTINSQACGSPSKNVITLFLTHFLEPSERVKADEGYRRHTDKVKCPIKEANLAE